MTEHFNNLTPAELERLALLSGELGKAQAAIGKILRHGYENYNPTVVGHIGNRADLALELGDVYCAMLMMYDAGDIERSCVTGRALEKGESGKRWLHHQETSDG